MLDYPYSTIEQSIQQSLNESCNEVNYLGAYDKYKPFLEAVLKAALKFYQDNKYLSDAEMIEPEFEFSIFDSSTNDNPLSLDGITDKPIYLNGSMDLFIKYQDEIFIIDYKSDFAGYKNDDDFSKLLREEYKNQIDIYKKSAKILFPNINKIRGSVIFFKNYDSKNKIAEAVEVKI